jgi:nitrite reductase (NADH) small subunit
MLVDIGSVAEVRRTLPRVVTIERRPIALLEHEGEIVAIRNVCPHRGGPLCHGFIRPGLEGGQVGERHLLTDTPALICPWHGWEFDLHSGRALADPRIRVRTYRTRVEGDRVLIEIGNTTAAARPELAAHEITGE